MKEEQFYETMQNMNKYRSFDKIEPIWYECFTYMIKRFKSGFTQKAIKELFYYFDMSNWEALHLENTEYKDYTIPQLKNAFYDECFYICDRATYDRIFRTHWLFRQAYRKQFNKKIWQTIREGEK